MWRYIYKKNTVLFCKLKKFYGIISYIYIPLQLFPTLPLIFIQVDTFILNGVQNAKYEYTTIKFSISCLLNKLITYYMANVVLGTGLQ